MSTTVDERVVSMKFDNAQFERETRTTMSTLDKLKEKLNFSKHADGLDDVNRAAKRVDFNPMANAADAVRVKFSYLQGSVQNVLNNIVNSAISAGKNIVSALTIDPIKTGLQEYETKINAIQVIRANTMGKNTMEEITAALDELNTYADKTIYNFAQMTSNVGKFVAQGLDVKQATNAIQGMANLAAASGASAEDMSRATYQMSQALGGVIRKIDWNSLRNANMATTTLKDTLMDIAKVEGIDIDKMIKNKGTFEDTLEEGWLTGEMFTKAMNIYSGIYSEAELKAQGFNDEQIKKFIDIAKMAESAATEVKTITQLWDVLKETAQSGWTQSWEYVIGDFETAKKDLTKAQNVLSDMLNKMADARNNLLKAWSEAGGRDDLVASVVNIFNAVKSIVIPIKEAFRDIFPPTTVEQLLKLTTGIKNFTAGLKLSDKASANLKSTFRGLFAAVDIVWKIFKAVLTAIKPIVGLFGEISGGVLGATGSFGEWIVALNDFIDKSGILTNVAEGIAFVFKQMLGFAKKYIKPFVDGIQNGLSRILGGAVEMKDGVVGAVTEMGSAVQNSSLVKVLTGFWKIIKSIASAISRIFGSAVGGLMDTLAGANFDKLLDFFNTLSLGGIAMAIAGFVKNLGSIAGTVSSFKDSIVGILDAVKGCFEAWQESIKATALLKIAAAVGILAISLTLLASIDSLKLTLALGAISALFGELMWSMSAFTKLSPTKDVIKSTWALVAFSSAILILAFALRTAAGADIDNMIAAGGVITGLMFTMVGVAKILGSSGKERKVIRGTIGMIGFAYAINILAKALRTVADADIDNMIVALVSISTLMFAMVGVAKILGGSDSSDLTKTAIGMLAFASAVYVLAAGLKMVADLEIEQVLTGLAGIVPLMAAMMGVTILLSKHAKGLVGVGLGLVMFAGAVDLLVIGVKALGEMDGDALTRGVVAIGLLMGAMIAFAAVVKNQSGAMIWAGIAMIPMATSMIIFAEAVERLGELKPDSLGRGLGALAVGLVAMTAALVVLSTQSTKVIAASGAIAIVCTSILLLAGAMKIFDSISWEGLGKAAAAFGALIAVFAVMTVLAAIPYTLAAMEAASLIMLEICTAMLELGVSVLLFGAGLSLAATAVVIFGVGLTSISIGLEALAVALPIITQSVFETLNVIVEGILKLGPEVVMAFAKGISIFCQAISLAASDIADAIVTVVEEVCVALVDIIPTIVVALLEIITQALSALVQYTPELVSILIDFFIALFDTLAVKMPELNESITNFVMAMLASFIEVFNQLDFRVVLDGLGAFTVICLILGHIAAVAPMAISGIVALGLIFLHLAAVVAILGLIYKIPFLQDLMATGGQFFADLGNAIGSFIGGIAGGVATAATSNLPLLGENLSAFMVALKPFIEGAKGVDESTMHSISALAKAILAITAANVLDSLTSWFTGGSSMIQFGMELAAFGPLFRVYAESVKGIDGDVVVASANAAKALAEMATNIPNTGGLVGLITGENSITQFAAELVVFGPSLKAYADSVAGLDSNVVVNSANAAKALAEMATNIPNTGGLVALITGENSIAQFAAELLLFGPSLKAYAGSIAGLDSNVVVNSANAAKALAEMAAIIPNMGGLLSIISGDNSLSVFGGELALFGPYMKKYSESVTGLKVAAVTSSAAAAKNLAEMAHMVSDGRTSGLISFGSSLATFGSNFKKFMDNLKNVSAEKIRAASEAIKEIMNIANLVSSSTASGLNSMGEALSTFASSSIDDFVNAFKNAKTRVATAATEMVTSFTDGVKESSPNVVSAFDTILADILTSANNQYDDFYTAGGYVVEGFATGISEKTWMAEAKAEAMARAALAAAKAALDEHSPSKAFYKVGAFAGEGFVNAFSDYESKSYKAGYGIADTARRGLSNAISRINDFINNGMDTQPTIRPVLDLSDIKSGAGAIGDMLGVGSSVGVMANVGNINSMMNKRNQNGTNADVVTAINKLRNELSGAGKTTYNINGITYDNGTDIADAIETLVRATTIERRI